MRSHSAHCARNNGCDHGSHRAALHLLHVFAPAAQVHEVGWDECGGTGAPCPTCNRRGHELSRLPFTPDDEGKRH
jgi:hypothetical protein